MEHPFDRAASQAHDYNLLIMEQTSSFGSRLGAWLVLGNAAALVIVFNGVMGGTGCDPNVVAASLRHFAAGLGAAFLGALVAYGGSSWGSLWMSKVTQAAGNLATSDFFERELRAQGLEVEPGSPIAVQAAEAVTVATNKTPVRWLFAAIVLMVALYLTSAALFAVGVLTPITASPAALARCMKATASDPPKPAPGTESQPRR